MGCLLILELEFVMKVHISGGTMRVVRFKSSNWYLIKGYSLIIFEIINAPLL